MKISPNASGIDAENKKGIRMTTVQHTANVIKEALRSEFRQSPLFIFCVNLFVVGSAFHRHQLDAQTFFLS